MCVIGISMSTLYSGSKVSLMSGGGGGGGGGVLGGGGGAAGKGGR